jgi:hypothetical protein
MPYLQHLIEMTSLKKLELGGNNLSCPAFATICTALQKNTTIKILDLSHNDLEDKNIFQLISVLCFSNSTLEEINLKGLIYIIAKATENPISHDAIQIFIFIGTIRRMTSSLLFTPKFEDLEVLRKQKHHIDEARAYLDEWKELHLLMYWCLRSFLPSEIALRIARKENWIACKSTLYFIGPSQISL